MRVCGAQAKEAKEGWNESAFELARAKLVNAGEAVKALNPMQSVETIISLAEEFLLCAEL